MVQRGASVQENNAISSWWTSCSCNEKRSSNWFDSNNFQMVMGSKNV